MKKLGFSILFVFAITLACNKNSSPPKYFGTASMTVNGVNWQADKVSCNVLSEFTCYNNKIEIDFWKFSPEGYLREDYAFVKILPAISLQKIYPINFSNICNDTLHASYGIEGADGDAGAAYYTSDSSGNNYFSVENYNSTTKEISGSFTVTFVLQKISTTDTTLADTVRITNGKFSTKILN